MRAQLRHLAQLAGRPGIAVQIMLLRGGGHPAAGGAFTICAMSYVGTTTERLPVRFGCEEPGSEPLAPGNRSRTLAVPTRLHIHV